MPPSGAGANVFIATVSLSSQSLFPRSQAVRRSTERNVSETRKIHPNSNSVDEGCLENAVQRTLGLNKTVEERVLGCVLCCLDGASREVEVALCSSRLCFESQRS